MFQDEAQYVCDFMHSSLYLFMQDLKKSRWVDMIKADMVNFHRVWVGGWMFAFAYVHFMYFSISLRAKMWKIVLCKNFKDLTSS